MIASSFTIGLGIAIIAWIGIIWIGRDLITLVIALELILLSAGILLVSLSFHLDDMVGSTLTLFILPLAGAESAIALGLLVAYYPNRGSLEIS